MATMTTSTRIAGVGVALTSSSTPDDDRVRFPSAPGPSTADKSPNAITHLLSSKRESVDVDNLLHRKPGDRSSLKLISDAWEVDRRRTSQQTEQKKGSKSLQSEESKSGSSSSPLMAELKSNVIIKDEFTLVTGLSRHLAQCFSRSKDRVMLKVDHSACLALGGTFDPCYTLALHAVPSLMTPSANNRNAALIQRFLSETLSVPAQRGIIMFCPIPEDHLAMNGTTVQGARDSETTAGPGHLPRVLQDISPRHSKRKNLRSETPILPKSNLAIGIIPDISSSCSDDSGSDDSDHSTPAKRVSTKKTEKGVDLAPRPSTSNGLPEDQQSSDLSAPGTGSDSTRPKSSDGTATTPPLHSGQPQLNALPPPASFPKSASPALPTSVPDRPRAGAKIDIRSISAPTNFVHHGNTLTTGAFATPLLSVTAAVPPAPEPRPYNTYLDRASVPATAPPSKPQALPRFPPRSASLSATPRAPPGPPPAHPAAPPKPRVLRSQSQSQSQLHHPPFATDAGTAGDRGSASAVTLPDGKTPRGGVRLLTKRKSFMRLLTGGLGGGSGGAGAEARRRASGLAW